MIMLYKHKDYDEYYKAQIDLNVKKIDNVWIEQCDIDNISKHINKYIPNAKFGICHGVRNAWEIKQFRKSLGIEVVGTEISHTASQFDNTIQWDFHKVKNEWVDAVDFIYSNSFDHSHSPEICLDNWMSCIKQEGICYIHWSTDHDTVTNVADCFSADKNEYREMFNVKYKVVDEFAKHKHRIIFAIKHRR